MFKIAYCAGHYINTPGKRVPPYIGIGEVREWTINDQVADYFAEAAKQYENVALLRTDDPTGAKFIDIPERTANANIWGADIYLDFHHNAGIGGGSGGGVVAYSYPGSAKGREYRDAIYKAVIAAGGLKGNRAEPVQEKAFDSLRYATAPAVLMEYGFMDSTVDAPIIVTKEYSKLVAYATMDAIAEVGGLKKKAVENKTPAEYTEEQFVREVQAAIGAKVDGIPGQETLSKTVTLSASKNRKHAAVKPVQKRLNALGYKQVGEADGIAGVKFTEAVEAFQEANSCWVDGEITARNKTWRKLLGMP